LTVSFMAIENFIIDKYKGKPSFTNSLLEDANTLQIEKKESETMHFKNVDEISVAQRFTMDAHYENHYDFRFKYLFGAIDNHMTKAIDILIPFLFMNSLYAPVFTMRLCEVYFFSRAASYLYDNWNLKNNTEGDGQSLRVNKILYLTIAGLTSVSILKGLIFPTKSWISYSVEKARQTSSTELQVLDAMQKNMPK